MLDATSRACDFPSLAGMIYLNSAAEGIPPLCVRDALLQYFQDKQLGMDGRLLHEAQWKAARGLTASFYGLTSEEVAICSCSSEAYNLAAMALQLRPGDEVIINDLEFPAGATPWLQQGSPATVKVWRHRDGFLHLEDLVPLLHSKTRFINVSLVSFLNGFRIHTPSLIEVVRKHSNALIGLDVTQALGRIPLDLRGVDLIISSTHKWILASHGGGLVGVPASKNTSLTVPAGGWFNLQDPFGTKRFIEARSKPGADSFAVGMPNYPAIYAIRAGLEYIQKVGVEKIDQATRPLVLHCMEELAKLPIEFITPQKPDHVAGILAFRHAKADHLHQHLRSKNIHVMGNAGRLRVAIHGYNTHEDVESFLHELKAGLKNVG